MRTYFTLLIVYVVLQTAYGIFGSHKDGAPPTRYAVTWLPSKEGRACANAALMDPGSKEQAKWCKSCTQEVRIAANNGPISFYPELGGCGLMSKKPAMKKNETFIHREMEELPQDVLLTAAEREVTQSNAYPLSVSPTFTLTGEEAQFFTPVRTNQVYAVTIDVAEVEAGSLEVNGHAVIDDTTISASLTLPRKLRTYVGVTAGQELDNISHDHPFPTSAQRLAPLPQGLAPPSLLPVAPFRVASQSTAMESSTYATAPPSRL